MMSIAYCNYCGAPNGTCWCWDGKSESALTIDQMIAELLVAVAKLREQDPAAYARHFSFDRMMAHLKQPIGSRKA